ncbi:UNVERIFIED_CONTAM: hypothetical protein Slati_4268400 [Sesamum latifolium]|uniref:Uncharacterized protein n=1 Tax=Sesamum latifolium TaxID=2727402 RepID=A0AAW2TBP9_9LAMI
MITGAGGGGLITAPSQALELSSNRRIKGDYEGNVGYFQMMIPRRPLQGGRVLTCQAPGVIGGGACGKQRQLPVV